NSARTHGNKEFIIHNDARITYTEFFRRADALSAWLVTEKELLKGKSVAINMKNCPEWMIAYVGIVQAGGVAVLINSRNDTESMMAALKDSDTVFVIADEKRLMKLRDAGCDLPALVSAPDSQIASDKNSTLFDSALNHTPMTTPVNLTQTDNASMLFTSGTTGRAKAAILSHLNVISSVMNTKMAMETIIHRLADQYETAVEVIKEHMPPPCGLLIFPLFHVSGLTSVFLTNMTIGGKIVVMDRWDAKQALALVEKEKITALSGVPATHWDMLNAIKETDYDLSSLNSVSNGGQAATQNLLKNISETYPNAQLGAGYGMTETTGAVSQANGEAFMRAPQSAGLVLPMVDIKIIGDDGNEMPLGEAGEICIRGATVMQGYYNRPEDTAKVMKDGWMHTGDVGYLDEEGYLYIVDRKTDMIISGGENIYCAEIEQTLGQHEAIKEIAAFGVHDNRLGEKLIVALSLNMPTETEQLDFYAREKLADYKVPHAYIITDEFNYTATGKIEKHKLRKAFLEAEKN
ncbi:MAG: class I adenylate-forming enzyme family protein, partial [Pseudomonadota bacterium]|nr:class I adenylate-forming enzyme family protein [Pseudomonadota bacterium]